MNTKTAEFGRWTCKRCGSAFRTRRELFAHHKICDNTIDANCPFCGKHFSKTWGLTNHISLCKKNPNADVEKRKRISEAQKKFWSSDKAKNLKVSASKRAVFNNFWEYRSKNPIVYESPFAGKVRLDSQWEKLVAERLDKLGIEWYRPKMRLPYFDCDGNEHSYIPDFYIKTFHCFIEVKSNFISKWQNSNNKVSYIKEHYPFVVWLETEEDCKTFVLKDDYGYEEIPPKNEDIQITVINSNNTKRKKSTKDILLKEERWKIIQNSEIDFQKFGWVNKIAKLFGIKSPNKAGIYIKNNFPDFYKSCFVRN